MKLSRRKRDKLYPAILMQSSNVIVALLIAQYTERAAATNKPTRSEIVFRSFTLLLEKSFVTHKRPAYYASQINLSVAYLNECLKNTTGFSVTHHIHQRIILEAKRLLYYSDKSVKEIAMQLGYDDYAYFSRLFAKITGMTASAFRNVNRD
ncbi:helix-turn-helix domain-containing protein [Chryseobacterium camelliae]|uniref:helix-turn-helix domain-containing protein n=1 Tax=Chryseobacterium camelliae TaxID=1265445 RepID=UPI00285D6CA0|nr:helix-turn-helix domain-containing protein [Chryseobacterium camelliae]MDR6514593.1 AraC-like DNA-binding protein [Chryseobacterium camelliae]